MVVVCLFAVLLGDNRIMLTNQPSSIGGNIGCVNIRRYGAKNGPNSELIYLSSKAHDGVIRYGFVRAVESANSKIHFKIANLNKSLAIFYSYTTGAHERAKRDGASYSAHARGT